MSEREDLELVSDSRVNWSFPMTLKEMAARTGMSPRRFKRYLRKMPGSFRKLYHTCFQVRLDLLPESMRRRLENP